MFCGKCTAMLDWYHNEDAHTDADTYADADRSKSAFRVQGWCVFCAGHPGWGYVLNGDKVLIYTSPFTVYVTFSEDGTIQRKLSQL